MRLMSFLLVGALSFAVLGADVNDGREASARPELLPQVKEWRPVDGAKAFSTKGIDVYWSADGRFAGNAFDGCKVGFKVWNVKPGNLFSGNRFERTKTPWFRHGKVPERTSWDGRGEP